MIYTPTRPPHPKALSLLILSGLDPYGLTHLKIIDSPSNLESNLRSSQHWPTFCVYYCVHYHVHYRVHFLFYYRVHFFVYCRVHFFDSKYIPFLPPA